jgi:hypothetical protein
MKCKKKARTFSALWRDPGKSENIWRSRNGWQHNASLMMKKMMLAIAIEGQHPLQTLF